MPMSTVGLVAAGVLEAIKIYGQITAAAAQQANISKEEAKAAFMEGYDERIAELRKPIDEVKE